MQAALAGVEIVTPAWIEECIRTERIIHPPTLCIIRSLPMSVENLLYPAFGVAKLAAARSEMPPLRLLAETSVFLVGTFASKQCRDIATLLEAAGAATLSNAGAVKKSITSGSRVVCLCSPTPKVTPALESAIRSHVNLASLVDSKWLFDCISCGSVLGAKGYAPQGGLAAELWRLAINAQK
jgi:hypothetical protein